MQQHKDTTPKPPSQRANVAVSNELEQVILRCLAKNPDDRPQSAGQLSAELKACSPLAPWNDQDAQTWWQQFNSKSTEVRHDRTIEMPGETMVTDFGH